MTRAVRFQFARDHTHLGTHTRERLKHLNIVLRPRTSHSFFALQESDRPTLNLGLLLGSADGVG